MVVQNDQLMTLNLLNLEIIGSFIGIIGLSIFILTSNSSINVLLNPSLSSGQFRPTQTLDSAALAGRVVLVTAGFIATYTTTSRLIQLNQRVLQGKLPDGTLLPNIWLTFGIWISLAGGLIALVGDYIRTQQPPRLPIQ